MDKHAIYNCPLKKSSKEESRPVQIIEEEPKKTVMEEVNSGKGGDDETDYEATSKQVYVSGLPYDMNVAKLLRLLDEKGCEGEATIWSTLDDFR